MKGGMRDRIAVAAGMVTGIVAALLISGEWQLVIK